MSIASVTVGTGTFCVYQTYLYYLFTVNVNVYFLRYFVNALSSLLLKIKVKHLLDYIFNNKCPDLKITTFTL